MNSVCYDFILNQWSPGELRCLTQAHSLARHGEGRNMAAQARIAGQVAWQPGTAAHWGRGSPVRLLG
jgi:hypothetical protein